MTLRSLLIPLLLILSAPLYGGEYQFSHMDSNNSTLSNNAVRKLYKDSRGFVWIGTHKGLNRYDGKRITVYDRNDFGSPSDFINVMQEDREGNLWIGTDHGVVIYSYDNDSFCTLSQLDPMAGSIDDRIFAIACNSKGVMWISSRDKGLFSWNPSERVLRKHPMASPDRAPVTNIFRIAIDRLDGMYLAVLYDNIYYADENATSLRPVEGSSVYSGDDIEGLTVSPSSDEILYVAGNRSGLSELNLRTSTIRTLWTQPEEHRPTALTADASGTLWMSTTCGLLRCDPASGATSLMQYESSNPFSLSSSYVTDAIPDKWGGLWVGTLYEGVNHASTFSNNFSRYYQTNKGVSLSGSIVTGFSEDEKGRLWISTEKQGLLMLDGGVLESWWDKNPEMPIDITGVCAADGYVWLGTQKGVIRLDPRTFRIKDYSSKKTGDQRLVSFYKSNDGQVYACYSLGVSRYHSASDSFIPVESLSNFIVESMAEDSKGTMWIATYFDGVYTFDPSKDVITDHFCPQTGSVIPGMVSSVTMDSRGQAWVIGFTSGCFRHVKESGGFEEFNRAKLPSMPSDLLRRAIPDKSGVLWISSDKGLMMLNPDNYWARTFTVEDGLLDNDFTKSALKLSDGSMVFGSANGFIRFRSDSFRDGVLPGNVVISEMVLLGETVRPGEHSVCKENPDVVDKISLGPSENTFGFSFASPTAPFPASTRILCRLDGYDEVWTDATNGRTIMWYNVPRGTYTLKIKTVGLDGTERPGHKDVTVIVRPYFLASFPGIMLEVITLLLLISGVIAIILRIRKENERKRMDAFVDRQNRAMLKDKMTFFTNVIHEIKTPLTLIHTPINKMMASDKLDPSLKEEATIISNSADSLDQLVRELLDYVRVEEHGYVLSPTRFDIVELARFLCFNFSDTVRDKNLSLVQSFSQEKIIIEADKNAVSKMLSNLIHNAVKFAESKVEVAVEGYADSVVVRVRNDGALIPPERRKVIFEPFVQYSSEHQPYGQSFGIGLSFAQSLAKLHNGSLTLNEDAPVTEFVITLPRKEEQVAEPDNSVQTSGVSKEAHRHVILLVEDNASLLSYLNSKLSEHYSVVGVPSAEIALQVLEQKKVDMIITDVALHGISGVELCKKVSGNFSLSHIPIIVLSAISSVDTKIRCIENGALLYIEKPFSMDYLEACIKGIFEKRSQLRADYLMPEAGMDISKYNLPNQDEEFLKKLEKAVRENLDDSQFQAKNLEEILFVSHSTLNRKVRALLGTTPNDFIKMRRLTVAAELLAKGNVKSYEVCYAVGFNSPSYFAKCFKSIYGMLPQEYARQSKPQE